MFKITPIGSCRIATPLRLARDRYGFALNQDRVYGFTHSSAEAVQLMRYLKGEIAIDPAVEPLVSRRGISEEEGAASHDPSDLYVVEVSSSKVLKVGETCVQLNYLGAEYGDFFQDRDRAGQFWDLADAGDQTRIDSFLKEHWSATPAQKQDSAILRQIRRAASTEADLRRDFRSLIDGLPAVLFVTHVDAVTPDGKPIPSRSRFIREVEAAVRAEGGVVYNPTRSMQQMGQQRAIEDYSDSLAHFTEEFAHTVFRDWFDLKIGGEMDACAIAGGSDEVRRILKPHVEARLAAGEAGSLARRLERVAKALPDCVEVPGLLAGTYAAVGQAEDALRTLREASLVGQPIALQRRWFALALELANADEVIAALAALTDSGVRIAGRDLLAAAELLAREGQTETAVRCAIQALERDADLTRAADLVLDLGGKSAVAGLDQRLRDRMARALTPARSLQFLYLAGCESDLVDLISRPGAVVADDLADFSRQLLPEGELDLAADLITRWRQVQDPDRLVHPGLRAVVDSLADAALRQPDRAARIAGLERVLQVNPLHVEARLALRSLRRDILADIRALADAGDIGALDSLRREVESLSDPVREYDILRMRALFAQGDFGATVAAARRVTSEAPDNMAAWATMMRAAQKSGDFLTVDEAAHRIVDKADDDSRRLADEAQDRLDRNPVLCFRAAREEVDPLQAVQLFTIARRDPALAKASDLRLKRLEAQLTAAARDMESEDADRAGPFLDAAIRLLPDNPRLRLAAGRYLVKQRDYAAALPHWEFLRASAPGNDSYAFQLDRCRERLAPTVGNPA
jgi:tetratricopeptide (TPR) repeat protein